MKLDIGAWKDALDRTSLSTEEKLVGAIELSEEDLAGVAGAWGGEGEHHEKRFRKREREHHRERHRRRWWWW